VHAIRVGRKRVARLLRQAGLAGVSKRRSFCTMRSRKLSTEPGQLQTPEECYVQGR
jgi:hypothetical protein